MHWSRAYLGLPYQDGGRDRHACDCWGLARLIYAERLAIDLPSYSDAPDAAEIVEALDIVARGRSRDWTRIAPGEEQAFDLAWFDGSLSGEPAHVAVVMRPGLALHASRDQRVSAPLEYDRAPWPRLLTGFFRHSGMVASLDAA